MKLLYISMHSPFGPQCGAQKRSLQIFRALQQIGDTSIAIACWRDMSEEEIWLLSSQCLSLMHWNLEKSPLCGIQDRLCREISAEYLNTDGFSVPSDAKAAIGHAIDQHDLVWVHSIRLANAFRRWQWPCSVVDIDDIPSFLAKTHLKTSNSVFGRAKSMHQIWQWRRRERLIFDRFSVAAVCSDDDKRYLGYDPRICVIPNGFDTSRLRGTMPMENRPRLGMIGSFTFRPNIDGVQWFLRQVWPNVLSRVPAAELRLIGQGGDDRRSFGGPQVTGLGFVDDPTEEIGSWSGMIVPIRIGGGTRVKIAEGFARGCPVIATSLGAYGYAVEHRREMLLADTPEAFAAACVEVLTDAPLRDRLTRAAADYFDQHLSWEALVPRVHKAVQACLDRSRSRGPAQHRDENCLKSPGS